MPNSCLVCSGEIVGRRSDAKYCSVQCNATAEKRRYKKKKFNVAVKPRGKNNGRTKIPTYGRDIQRKVSAKKRAVTGYKGRYAKARALGYRSMFEVAIVEAAKNEGMSLEYEPHNIAYELKANYVPDAVLPNRIYLEFKGLFTEQDRRKMLAVKKCNPDLDIRFVFQNANTRLTKSKKGKTYWQWCDKNGFQWSEKTIPLEWWDE